MSDAYAKRKAALGLKPTALDTGFTHDQIAHAEYPSTYVNESAGMKIIKPSIGEDLTHLRGNSVLVASAQKWWANVTPERRAQMLAKRRATLARKRSDMIRAAARTIP